MTADPTGPGPAIPVAPPSPSRHVHATGQRRVVAVRGEQRREVEDQLAGEEPIEIRAHGPGQAPRAVVTTMRTPGHEAELAVGWLFSEGLLRPGEVAAIDLADPGSAARPDDTVTVRLTRPLDLDAVVARHVAATAACGVCGRASIEELAARCEPVASPASVPWSVLAMLPDRLRDAQTVFAATGGLHATGLFTTDGTLVTLREDVGRHNAMDAAIGVHVLAGEVPLSAHVAVLSGRVGFELVQKAIVAGIPVVAAVGAPSDLAVRTAERFGVCVVGFLRDGDGNVYCHPQRIDLDT